MFESIVALAKALGFQVVAEGVETQRQYEYMRDAGCDAGVFSPGISNHGAGMYAAVSGVGTGCTLFENA